MKTTFLVAGLIWLFACAEVQPVPVQLQTPVSPPSSQGAASPPGERVTIALIGTSDLHGYVEPRLLSVKGSDGQKHTVRRGGLALLGGYLANIRAHTPTLLVDGGDMFQGTMVSNLGEGRAVVEAYNTLGYQAAAVGNHEFDFGPVGPRAVPSESGEDDPNGALKARAAEAHFPFLSSNLLDKKTGQPVTWPNVFPSTRVEIKGVPIGIIGALTEDTPLTTNILNLRDVTVAPVVPAVRAQAAALRASGVAAVILTIHEGANCSAFDDPRDIRPCENKDERILSIVRQLDGAVDAVVAGHSHAGVAHFVGEVPVIQAFSYGLSFGRVDLTFKKQGGAWQIERNQTHIFPPAELCEVAVPPLGALPAGAASSLAESSPPPNASTPGAGAVPAPRPQASRPASARCDARVLEGTDLRPAEYDGRPVVASAAIEAVLRPHLDLATTRANMPLGVTLADRVRRNFRNESALAQLMADLIRSGASRVVGRPVDIAVQNGGGIRNDLPAGPLNYVQVFEVQPFDNRLAVVRLSGTELIEIFRRNYASSHGVLVPSGIRTEGRCVDHQLQLTIRRENGELLDPRRTYTVAMSDFLASGGDNVGPSAPEHSVPGQPPSKESRITFYDDVLLRDLIVEELQRYRGPLLSGQLQPLRLGLPSPRPVDCAALPAPTQGQAAASSADTH